MIEQIKADIFTVEADAIIHQCNCFHTMGSGIAHFIRENFPEAYQADKQTKAGDLAKLGTFSFAKVNNPKYPNVKVIVNLYSQFDCSHDKRQTRYDAFADGLTQIRDKMRAKANGATRTIAIPWRMGSNRGGGSWLIIRAIIEDVFGQEKDFNVLICKNPAVTDTLQNKVSH